MIAAPAKLTAIFAKALPVDLPDHLLANPGPQQQEKYEFEEQDFEEILPMIRQK